MTARTKSSSIFAVMIISASAGLTHDGDPAAFAFWSLIGVLVYRCSVTSVPATGAGRLRRPRSVHDDILHAPEVSILPDGGTPFYGLSLWHGDAERGENATAKQFVLLAAATRRPGRHIDDPTGADDLGVIELLPRQIYVRAAGQPIPVVTADALVASVDVGPYDIATDEFPHDQGGDTALAASRIVGAPIVDIRNVACIRPPRVAHYQLQLAQRPYGHARIVPGPSDSLDARALTVAARDIAGRAHFGPSRPPPPCAPP